MAVSHAQKVAILDELTQNVVTQKAIVLLTSQDTKESLDSIKNFELRKKAMDSGVKIQVVKNTLIRKLFEGVEGFPQEFVSSTYLVYLVDGAESDEVMVPKAIVSLIKKEFADSLKVLGAVVNGEFYPSEKTIELSKTPSFADSMSMMAGMLQQITSRIAVATKEIPNSVARGVSEYSKTLS